MQSSPEGSIELGTSQKHKNDELKLWLELEEKKIALLAERVAMEESLTKEIERQLEVSKKLAALKSAINALNINSTDFIDNSGNQELQSESRSDHSFQESQCMGDVQSNHISLAHCPSYQQLHTVQQRWQLLKDHHACFRCLKTGHEASTCPEGVCGIDGCKRMHHSSLHIDSLHGKPPSSTQYLYHEYSHI